MNGKLEQSFNRITEQYRRVRAHHRNFLANPDYNNIVEELSGRINTFETESATLFDRKGREFIADMHQRAQEIGTYQGDAERHLVSVLHLMHIPEEYLRIPDQLMEKYPTRGHFYRAMQSLIQACEVFTAEYEKVYPAKERNQES